MGVAKGYLPFMDPTIKWYVRPSLRYLKIVTGGTPATNSIQYSCDDAICLPRYYGAYMSWYDPSSTTGVGGRMFDKQEAWDHANRSSPNTSYPYNGRIVFFPGYGGFFLALPLTDGSNIVQINIIRRYIDDTILIYNTGKYGDTSYNISVVVYDPPSALGYNVQTNGTRGAGQTTLAPGQYVLFYRGITAPAVDATTGVFQTSPFGVNKSWPYELWVNSFTYQLFGVLTVTIPKMYLGVKAPGADMEIISNGAYPGVSINGFQSGTSGKDRYPVIFWGGQWAVSGYNVSSLSIESIFQVWIRKDDPNVSDWNGGSSPYEMWFGWGEDDAGNVKFILLSSFLIIVDTNYIEKIRQYNAYIYDVDRGEAYVTHIIKPTVNVTLYGENKNDSLPLFTEMRAEGTPSNASAFAYIDANDVWNKTTSAASKTWTYHDNAYGFCNFFSGRINCAEGLGIYTDDSNYTPPAPKSAFGAARASGSVGAEFPRVPSLARTLTAGKIYAVVTRMKTFPSTATDTDLQNWFKSLPPKALASNDFNALLGVLPGSFWLFGELVEEGSITVPDTITPGGQFEVKVSCPTRPNRTVWAFMVDPNGNIVASAEGITDANGNASITLTAPNAISEYRVAAIIKGSRKLE